MSFVWMQFVVGFGVFRTIDVSRVFGEVVRMKRKGVVVDLKPVVSVCRLESGKLVFWHDRTINGLLKRAARLEARLW